MALSTLSTLTKRPWVCTEMGVDRVTCEWTIPISELLSMENGDVTFSPIFYTGNGREQWSLGLFPRGDDGTSADSISCYLYLDESERLGINAEFTISIWKSNVMMKQETFTHRYDKLWGFGEPRFIKQSKVLVPDYYEITVVVQCQTDSVTSTQQLTENLHLLCDNPKFSDITIIVGDIKFPAHRNILSVRSSVFAAMFHYEGMVENRKNELKIKDLEPAVVKGMLEYIYTGGVTDLELLAHGLLIAAEKYDLGVLKVACEDTISKNLTVNNASEILMLAHLHRASRLKEFVLKFMKDNLRGVIQTDGYKQIIDQALLKEIISFGV